MMENANNNEFIGYEYKEVTIPRSMDSVYTDGYANFGWQPEGSSATPSVGKIVVKYKRNRKLRNKAEITRLQRKFDAWRRRDTGDGTLQKVYGVPCRLYAGAYRHGVSRGGDIRLSCRDDRPVHHAGQSPDSRDGFFPISVSSSSAPPRRQTQSSHREKIRRNVRNL